MAIRASKYRLSVPGRLALRRRERQARGGNQT